MQIFKLLILTRILWLEIGRKNFNGVVLRSMVATETTCDQNSWRQLLKFSTVCQYLCNIFSIDFSKIDSQVSKITHLKKNFNDLKLWLFQFQCYSFIISEQYYLLKKMLTFCWNNLLCQIYIRAKEKRLMGEKIGQIV